MLRLDGGSIHNLKRSHRCRTFKVQCVAQKLPLVTNLKEVYSFEEEI